MAIAGRILNRFSSDVSTADDALPFTLNIFLASLANLIGLLIVIGFSQPLMLLGFIPLAIMYRTLQVRILSYLWLGLCLAVLPSCGCVNLRACCCMTCLVCAALPS